MASNAATNPRHFLPPIMPIDDDMFHRWYNLLTNYARLSNRLLSFFASVYHALRLDTDPVHLNAVRLCAEQGLYVHGLENGQFTVRCFSCQHETYANLFAFCANVRAIRDTARLVSSYHFRHAHDCRRHRDNMPDCNYLDVLFLCTLFERYTRNPVLRELRTMHEEPSQQQQRDVPDVLQCRVCQERQMDVAFLPCGHVFACCRCVMRGMDVNAAQRDSPSCYVCRQPLSSIQYIYFA